MPEKVLSKIESIKESLADTKYYHLNLNYDTFYITDKDGEKLYQPFLINNAGKVLLVKARQGLSTISKKLKFNSAKEVSQISDRIKQASTQFERAAEIVKVLDEYEQRTML